MEQAADLESVESEMTLGVRSSPGVQYARVDEFGIVGGLKTHGTRDGISGSSPDTSTKDS